MVEASFSVGKKETRRILDVASGAINANYLAVTKIYRRDTKDCAAVTLRSNVLAPGEERLTSREFTRRIALLILIAGMLPGQAIADSWPGPRVATVFSSDGEYFVRITPGKSVGDTFGFAGAPKGPYARAEFYRRQPDRSYRLIADATLDNPVAPVEALVSTAGQLITFDNWHNAGYGRVVAIYGSQGQRVASYDLERLYSPERLPQLPMSVSSRWWRCAAKGYVDPGKETSVYVTERLGGTFVFELATGTFEYRPGTAICQ